MKNLSELPIGAKIRFVQDALQRELKMRSKFLTGVNRAEKCKEASDCLALLRDIEDFVRGKS